MIWCCLIGLILVCLCLMCGKCCRMSIGVGCCWLLMYLMNCVSVMLCCLVWLLMCCCLGFICWCWSVGDWLLLCLLYGLMCMWCGKLLYWVLIVCNCVWLLILYKYGWLLMNWFRCCICNCLVNCMLFLCLILLLVRM